MNRLRGRGEKAGREPGIHWALKDVSFQIQPGEVVGVIGRNGAGKSTLLKVLSRITEPHSGRVTLRGRVGSLLEVGVGFHQELTGREKILPEWRIFGMSRREMARKFDAIVAFSEVEPFLDMPVKRYSSGMYVRLAFAVASHMEPEILLVDEVLAVGDAPVPEEVPRGRWTRSAGPGRTVLVRQPQHGDDHQSLYKGSRARARRLIFDGDCDQGVTQYVSRCNTDCDSEVDLAEHPNRRTGSQPILADYACWTRTGNRPTNSSVARRCLSSWKSIPTTASHDLTLQSDSRTCWVPAVHPGDLPDRHLAGQRHDGEAIAFAGSSNSHSVRAGTVSP